MLPQLPLPVQIFAAAVIFFHLSEFALAAIYMRSSLSWTSFLISTPYCVAMALALAEYTIEAALVPAMKEQLVIWVGLALVVVGDAIRKTAMVTAGSNFTHALLKEHHVEHKLVSHGIYRCGSSFHSELRSRSPICAISSLASMMNT
eukprot:evm.model.scf_319EXC.7 EVM.evm.TU.scf_319EXC.7   scf_319EXC:50371-56752(-)